MFGSIIIKLFCCALIFFISQTTMSYEYLDSLEKAVNIANDKFKPEIYNTLSKNYQNISSKTSLNYALLALKYSQIIGDKTNESLAYFNIGFNYVTLNNISEATSYFNKALSIRLKIGDKLLIANSYNALGNVSRLSGNNQQALNYYFKSLEIRKMIGDKLLIAATINNIGIVYKIWGKYEKALEYYLQSLKYAESLHDTTILIPSLINIGNLYSELKEYSKSLGYYYRVLKISKKTNNPTEISSTYNSIGTSYNYLNDVNKAIKYFNHSYNLAKQVGNIVTQCSSLNNLGESYQRLKDYDRALKYYELSAKLSSNSDDLNSNTTSLNNIGAIYRSKKEYKKALPYLLKSLELSTKYENFRTLKENYINLAMVYEGLKDYKKAYFYHCRYSDLNDSLFNESMNKIIVDMQIKFETEKKQKEIESLKNEKRIEKGKKNYLYALLILGALLIFVVLILFLIKLRANKTLAVKNELISNQKDQLSLTLHDLNKTYETNEKYLQIINDEFARATDYVISLIPQEMKNSNIKSQWLFKPSSILGGDIFGYHWIDSNNFAVYLIDVSGHGVGASLHSISILNTLKYQTLLNTDYKQPEQVLSSLNNIFQMHDHNNLFFTIWYGVFNNDTRELKYATAGHPPALLIDSQGQATSLATKNIMIGGGKKAEYSSSSTVIKPNSKLFIFSDGVYEIRDTSGNMWSIKELNNFILLQSKESENELDKIYKFALNYHEYDTLDDDFSILKISFE